MNSGEAFLWYVVFLYVVLCFCVSGGVWCGCVEFGLGNTSLGELPTFWAGAYGLAGIIEMRMFVPLGAGYVVPSWFVHCL